MKTCITCKQTKEENEFHFDHYNGRFRSYCKGCDSERVKLHQQKRKQEAVAYKGGKCQICGYDKYIGALDFHHLDPTKKDFALSKFTVYNFKRIKAELDKCIVVCANCHREIHGGVTTPKVES